MEAGQVFNMNCQEFWNTMPELACSQDQSIHLRDCAVCAARLEQQRALTGGLRAVAEEWRNVGAPPRVEARLIAAFRGHAGLGNTRPMTFRPQHVWLPVAAWLTAVAAVVFLAMVLVRDNQPAHRSLPVRSERLLVQASAESVAGDESPYDDGDYIPLPNAERILPNEDVNLVRVEVPRSTMITLGYEVSAERASEPVQAEVVLGADGLARAVRFLDE